MNWSKINGWDYSVSDKGDVYSHRSHKLMTIWCKKGKYPRVTLSNNGKEKTFCVHRLVAEAFIPNTLGKKTVNHIDGDKTNNHVSNLEWNTMSENMHHAVVNGLASPPKLKNGELHPASKLTNIDVQMIKILLNYDFTMAQIAKRFNVHEVHISNIKLNKTRVNG